MWFPMVAWLSIPGTTSVLVACDMPLVSNLLHSPQLLRDPPHRSP